MKTDNQKQKELSKNKIDGLLKFLDRRIFTYKNGITELKADSEKDFISFFEWGSVKLVKYIHMVKELTTGQSEKLVIYK